MATLTGKSSSSRGLQFGQFLRNRVRPIASAGALRATLIAAVVAGVMMPVHTHSASQSVSVDATADCPPIKPRVDLAFIIDRSGSLDPKFQGQTYNIEIEGVRRALLDPGVIPRDGSIAVAVFTFAGAPALVRTFTEIKSAADANVVAAAVEALKCSSDETCPQKGSQGESKVGIALSDASLLLNNNRRAGARQVFVVSSDGGFTDIDFAKQVSDHLEGNGSSEIDVILLGNEVDRATAVANADSIVFPEPTSVLPGATIVIDADDCNRPGAASSCADLSAPRVKKFAEHVRSVLRSPVTPLFLTVNTQADPPPNTPVSDGPLSLRQAIERANINGGATTITFASTVTTIKPTQPLPALTASEITICGCEAKNCNPVTDDNKKCQRLVTIDGIGIARPKDPAVDGILIRSNRNVVRGLKIINFERAGVGIDSRCVSDNVGFNRIERNVFENNTQAGVCVLDPMQNSDNAVVHNVGNTISMNDFSATGIPIDLACDGPTPNDLGDPDQGPNTLLNFPDKLDAMAIAALDVTAAAAGVTLSGQLVGPTAAGSVVEIFSIDAFKPVPGGRLIDSVTFLARITADANGRFSVTGLSDSPTCGYTATATDLEGNTSELMSPCSGFGRTTVTDLEFTEVAAPNGTRQSGTITVENVGCAPLTLTSYSVKRDGFGVNGPDPNDRSHFFIEEAASKKGKTNREFDRPITIDVGESRTFTVLFDPAIPKLAGTTQPPASYLLPDTINSTLTIVDDGCPASDTAKNKMAHLTAKVDAAIKLINPSDPKSAPVISLVRSKDTFTVTFSIFDSKTDDVDTVIYEFKDQTGALVSLEQSNTDLSAFTKGLAKGQSFTVKQDFSNAKKNRKVASVQVTVSGKNGSKASAFGSMSSSSAPASALSVVSSRSTVLVLPVVKLTPASTETRKAP